MTRIFSISSRPPAGNRIQGPRRESGVPRRSENTIGRLHQLLIVGEAVKRTSPEFRDAHPEVPWKLIAGTRDKLIHFYEGVDLVEVWKMVTSDLSELIRLIEPLAPHVP